MLQQTFIALIENYTKDDALIYTRWAEIEKNHSHKKRFYHNLSHLENLLLELEPLKSQISNWHAVLFTLFYHDAIYNTLKSDNEEKSAELAVKRMNELNVPAQLIESCREQILATKKHFVSPNPDTNFFTDADLSILGATWETYSAYAKNIRREYSIYPDLVYNPGRKKVLQHFLAMERIYKTGYFFDRYEKQAKKNLQAELDSF